MKKFNINKLSLIALIAASLCMSACGNEEEKDTTTAKVAGIQSSWEVSIGESTDGDNDTDEATSKEGVSEEESSLSEADASGDSQSNGGGQYVADNNPGNNAGGSAGETATTKKNNPGETATTKKNNSGETATTKKQTDSVVPPASEVEIAAPGGNGVGNAESNIADSVQNAEQDNKTEYVGSANNSSVKQIYISENSVNYKYAIAYVNGDLSRLDATEQQIFGVVKPLIDNVLSTYSTDPEREKAIHDYIIMNCRYNIEDCDADTLAEFNFHPEGVFLNKKAVCQGYAEAFKLCMDLIGIKCDMVTGTGNGVPHAWNAVCLEGAWYQVDCTWDDPLVNNADSGKVFYNYFNITDARMKQDHIYTYSNACNGTKYSYDYFATAQLGTIYGTVNEYCNYIKSLLPSKPTTITANVRISDSVTIDSYFDGLGTVDFSARPASGSGFQIGAEAVSVTDTIWTITITFTDI